jgi:hypothetical protein
MTRIALRRTINQLRGSHRYNLLICNHLCVHRLGFKRGKRNLLGNEPIWSTDERRNATRNTVLVVRIEGVGGGRSLSLQ